MAEVKAAWRSWVGDIGNIVKILAASVGLTALAMTSLISVLGIQTVAKAKQEHINMSQEIRGGDDSTVMQVKEVVRGLRDDIKGWRQEQRDDTENIRKDISRINRAVGRLEGRQ